MSNPFKAGSLSVTPTSVAARDAIASPVDGQIIYLTHDDLAMSVPLAVPRYEYYHAETATWYELGSGPADPAIFVSLKDGSGTYVAPEAIGGIENTSQQGADLDGLSVADVLNRMLYPTLYPTSGQPSAGLTLEPLVNSAEVLLVEYGESINKTMSASFSRGTITSSYTMLDSQGNVADTNTAGLPNTYRFYFKGSLANTQATTALTATYSTGAGAITSAFDYEVQVDFDQGAQPYDSTGAPFGSRLPAGTKSRTKTVNVSYYNYNNGDADAVLNLTSTGPQRQDLLATGTGYEIEFTWSEAVEDGGVNRHTFAFADAYGTVSKIQQYNTVGGSWDDIVILDLFAISTTTRTAPNGDAVNYNVYTATAGRTGSRRFKVFF